MNSLVKSLIQPILEQEGQNIALIPGGFKPPTLGHFYLVNEVANNSNIDKVLILIGHKDRDGITKEESEQIWNVYQKYLPSNVEVQISQNPSPISDINSIIKNNPSNFYFPVVGIRGEEDMGDLKRFDSLKGKYNNFKPIIIKSEREGDRISGTNARLAILNNEFETFQKFLPTELSNEDRDKIWNILTNTPLDELLTKHEINSLEKIADEWFEDYGIDVEFTKHFIERVNDPRNGKPISYEELENIFTQSAEKYGLKLSELPDNYQAVLFKLRNDINIPFVLNYDDKNDEIDLVAKTIMRKKNFQTSNPKLALQEEYAEPSEYDYPKLIQSLTKYMLDKGMNIRPLPKVKFIKDDIENARNFFGKTAYYDPNNRVVVLYTMDRHPKDVMRSFAHEMIHHMQNCDGRLDNITTQNTNEEGDLPDIEKEAYEKGNMTFRNWTDSITNSPLNEILIKEGRYDKITNQISSAIFNQWKNDITNGNTSSRYEQYFPFETEEISIDANLSLIPELKKLSVDGHVDDEIDHIEVRFEIDPNKLPEFWEEISMNLKDVIRHEIEHLTHGEGFTSNPNKHLPDDMFIRQMIDIELLPKPEYFKLKKEIDANLQGMYLRAKKEKRPFSDVINTYLDAQDITPEEKEEILDLWRSRLKALNLPLFENEIMSKEQLYTQEYKEYALKELFEKDLPNIKKISPTEYIVGNGGDIEAKYYFKLEIPEKNIWSVNWEFTPNNQNTTPETWKQVTATSFKILKDFIQEKNPTSLHISGNTDVKTKLYKNYITKLETILNNQYKIDNSDEYSVILRSIKELAKPMIQKRMETLNESYEQALNYCQNGDLNSKSKIERWKSSKKLIERTILEKLYNIK